jgi:hypothetical protein
MYLSTYFLASTWLTALQRVQGGEAAGGEEEGAVAYSNVCTSLWERTLPLRWLNLCFSGLLCLV